MKNAEYKTNEENKAELLAVARRMTAKDIKVALRQRAAFHQWAVEAYEQALDEKNLVGINELAERLADAYSTPNYGGSWRGCVRMLRFHKLTDAEIEAVIRSKWTRWAADQSDKPYGKTTSRDLERFMDKNNYWGEEVKRLTKESF
jgi:hypothetical protein